MDKILIIGACGQLGTELTLRLREVFSKDQVIACDLNGPTAIIADGPFEVLDVNDRNLLETIVKRYKITQVYHLAAILSANAEKNPRRSWDLNMGSLLNVLEAAAEHRFRVFWPSSIAVFGPDTPKTSTPQKTVMNPNTVYGISKLAGERWCEYFHLKFGVDVRSLRYPGLIGYKSKPGGGTTDYAVDIFWKAILERSYVCFLQEDTMLPMMFMDDAVKATVDLMQSDGSKLTIRTSYNLSGISFSPRQIASKIAERYPEFEVSFEPDFRQKIADSWPNSIDDSIARRDWGWQPGFDIDQLSKTMLDNLELTLVSTE